MKLIGFGFEGEGGTLGKKRAVEMRVVLGNADTAYFIRTDTNGVGACGGDSGGPYLFNGKVVAEHITGPCKLTGGTRGVLIRPHKDFIMSKLSQPVMDPPKTASGFSCENDRDCESGVCLSAFEGVGVCK